MKGFNPLDRGNLNQMLQDHVIEESDDEGFNPLNRGNLNQIPEQEVDFIAMFKVSIP